MPWLHGACLWDIVEGGERKTQGGSFWDGHRLLVFWEGSRPCCALPGLLQSYHSSRCARNQPLSRQLPAAEICTGGCILLQNTEAIGSGLFTGQAFCSMKAEIQTPSD